MKFNLSFVVAVVCLVPSASAVVSAKEDFAKKATSDIKACLDLCQKDSCPKECADLPKLRRANHKSFLHGWKDFIGNWAQKKHLPETIMTSGGNLDVAENPKAEGYEHGYDETDTLFQESGPSPLDISQAIFENGQWPAVLAAMANTKMGRDSLVKNINVDNHYNFVVAFHRPTNVAAYVGDSGTKSDLFATDYVNINTEVPLENESADKRMRPFPLRVFRDGKNAIWPIVYTKALSTWLTNGGFKYAESLSPSLDGFLNNLYAKVNFGLPGVFSMSVLLGRPTVTVKAKKITRGHYQKFASMAKMYPTIAVARSSTKTGFLAYKFLRMSKIVQGFSYTVMGLSKEGKVHLQNPFVKMPKVFGIKLPDNRDIYITVKEFQKRIGNIIVPREAAVKVLGNDLKKYIM